MMIKSIIRGLIILLMCSAAELFAQNKEEINLLIMQEEYEQAAVKLNAVIEKDSSDTDAMYKLGLCCLGLNDNYRAVEVLGKAAEKNKSTTVLLSLARAFRNAGNDLRAKEVYQYILNSDSLNRSAASNLADLYMDLQDYKNAYNHYSDLCLNDSSNSFYLKQAGWCLFKMDELPRASEYYERAILLNSDDVNAALDLSLIYFRMEKLDSAFMTVLNVYGAFGEDPRLDKMLGDIEMKRKEYSEAEQYYKRAIVNGDSSAAVLQKLGITLYLSSVAAAKDSSFSLIKASEAREVLIRANKKNNKDVLTNLYLGLSYKKLKDYTSAISFLEGTVKLAIPAYINDVYNDLASAYELNSEFRKALECYNKSLEYESANRTNYYLMGCIYDLRLSETKNAVKNYRKYLEWPQGDKLLKTFAKQRIDQLTDNQSSGRGTSQK